MVTETDSNADLQSEDEEDDDPHASKIAADDPRLKSHRPKSRVLRMAPVIGSIAAVLAIGGGLVISGVRSRAAARDVSPEPVKLPAHSPSVPAFIQQAPSTPAPPQPAAPAPLPAALPTPGRATFEPMRPDPREQQALQQELARRAELERAEAEARNSGLFFAFSAPSSTGGASPAGSPPPALAGAGLPGMAQPPQSSDAWDPNLQTRKNAFLEAPSIHPDYLSMPLLASISPYEVKAGTHIPATLIYGINSDLPGQIVAQVREQVYDTVSGEHLLIPQGARLLASYDSMVAWGQERVLMCWKRLILPNGKSINLECMPAADLRGQAGLTDEVDNHWDRLVAAVGLSTVLSLGAQAAAGDPTSYQPNLAQRAASNAAGQINNAGQAVVQRQINLQPTITVRPGYPVIVQVTKDMVLEPYVD